MREFFLIILLIAISLMFFYLSALSITEGAIGILLEQYMFGFWNISVGILEGLIGSVLLYLAMRRD